MGVLIPRTTKRSLPHRGKHQGGEVVNIDQNNVDIALVDMRLDYNHSASQSQLADYGASRAAFTNGNVLPMLSPGSALSSLCSSISLSSNELSGISNRLSELPVSADRDVGEDAISFDSHFDNISSASQYDDFTQTDDSVSYHSNDLSRTSNRVSELSCSEDQGMGDEDISFDSHYDSLSSTSQYDSSQYDDFTKTDDSISQSAGPSESGSIMSECVPSPSPSSNCNSLNSFDDIFELG